MRDGEFDTMIKHQEEYKAQKLMDKEQRDMSSMPTEKALLLIQRVLYLHHFLQSSIPQKLDVASKVTTLATDSIYFCVSFTLSTRGIQSYQKNATLDVGQHYTNSSSLGMIFTNRLMTPTERITSRATTHFSGLPTYDLWSLGCILYHRLFGFPLRNFDFQQINSLILFLYTTASISLQILCLYLSNIK